MSKIIISETNYDFSLMCPVGKGNFEELFDFYSNYEDDTVILILFDSWKDAVNFSKSYFIYKKIVLEETFRSNDNVMIGVDSIESITSDFLVVMNTFAMFDLSRGDSTDLFYTDYIDDYGTLGYYPKVNCIVSEGALCDVELVD